MLGAATWRRPHVVILDEPTNYLDRESLAALIEALKVYEGGVLIITHNREFSESICSEVWAMRDGNLVASGHNWVEGQGSGERIDKKADVEEEASLGLFRAESGLHPQFFDAMGNKIDAPKKVRGRAWRTTAPPRATPLSPLACRPLTRPGQEAHVGRGPQGQEVRLSPQSNVALTARRDRIARRKRGEEVLCVRARSRSALTIRQHGRGVVSSAGRLTPSTRSVSVRRRRLCPRASHLCSRSAPLSVLCIPHIPPIQAAPLHHCVLTVQD